MLEPTSSSCIARSRIPTTMLTQMTSVRSRQNSQRHELYDDRAGDDPGVARLAAGEVADEDVRDREERHRNGELREQRSRLRELGAKASNGRAARLSARRRR